MNDFKGYKSITLGDNDYLIWSLWDSNDIIYMQEILYKNMMEDDIYIKCIRFETDYDTQSKIQTCIVYKDAILSCNALESEDFSEEELVEKVKEFNKKVLSGKVITMYDIIPELVGAGSYYNFYDEGEEVATLTFDEDTEMIEEVERIGDTIFCN